MSEQFPISPEDILLLQTKPATEESLGRAALLGVELGQAWTTQQNRFRENLRLTIAQIARKELISCPGDTVITFADAAFKTRTYLESRSDLLSRVGPETLESINQAILAPTTTE